jgi:hypothetical protein
MSVYMKGTAVCLDPPGTIAGHDYDIPGPGFPDNCRPCLTHSSVTTLYDLYSFVL